jgi:hypothetical protein
MSSENKRSLPQGTYKWRYNPSLVLHRPPFLVWRHLAHMHIGTPAVYIEYLIEYIALQNNLPQEFLQNH